MVAVEDIVNKYEDFDEAFSDGRMTAPSNGKLIKDLFGAIAEVDRLGRPLTDDELKKYM